MVIAPQLMNQIAGVLQQAQALVGQMLMATTALQLLIQQPQQQPWWLRVLAWAGWAVGKVVGFVFLVLALALAVSACALCVCVCADESGPRTINLMASTAFYLYIRFTSCHPQWGTCATTASWCLGYTTSARRRWGIAWRTFTTKSSKSSSSRMLRVKASLPRWSREMKLLCLREEEGYRSRRKNKGPCDTSVWRDPERSVPRGILTTRPSPLWGQKATILFDILEKLWAATWFHDSSALTHQSPPMFQR